MSIFKLKGVTKYVFFILVFGLVLSASSVKAEEAVQLDDSQFTVLDGFTDVAEISPTKKVFRTYSKPRAVYTDAEGILRQRPADWTWFNEDTTARILKKSAENGYEYSVQVDNETIKVFGSDITIGERETEKIELQSNDLVKTISNDRVYTNFIGIYPNIDINFIDHQLSRNREIVIKQNPDISSGKELVFWENFTFPDSAKLVDLEGNEIRQSGRLVHGSLFLRIGDYSYLIGGGTVLDASGQEKYTMALEQIVKIDRENKILSVGMVLPANYLNNPIHAYPITIDPTYNYQLCGGSNSTVYPYNCNSLFDFYFRQLDGTHQSTTNGGGDARSSDTFNYLVAGKDTGTSGTYQRASVLKFDLPYISQWIGNGDIDSAYLRLYKTYYNGYPYGDGSYTGSINLAAKRITNYWNYSSSYYNNINTDSYYNYTSVPYNYIGTVSIDVTDIVDNFWAYTSPNYGFLVEPYGSGSSWPDREMFFSSHEGTVSPYLEMTVTYKPNLDPVSGSNSTYIDSSSYNINPGGTVSGRLTVENNGHSSGGSTPQVYVKFFLNKNGVSHSSGHLFTKILPPISVGSNYASNFSYSVPSNLTAGDYYLSYYIDSDNQVAETSESDNLDYFSQKITVSAPTYPDLTYSNLNPASGVFSAKPGDTVNISYNVYNQGNAGANSGYVNYYLNKNNPSTSNGYQGNDSYSSLSAGNISSESFSVIVPSSAQAGDTYYLTLDIDSNNSTSNESSETNNDYDFTINVTAPAQPDLEVDNFYITNTNYTYSGNTVSIRGDVKNNGQVGVNSVNYRLSLVDTNNPTNIYHLSPIGQLSSVPAGANTNMSLSGTIPHTVPYLGSYYVRVDIDYDNIINNESNENNNIDTTSNSITVERYNYGGGGGGTNDDYDNDGYKDNVEMTAGTDVNGANLFELGDSDTLDALASFYDQFYNDYWADPVNIRTGALELNETDFSLPSRGFDLELNRVYNSKLYDWSGRFGYGWNFKYNNFYYKDPVSSAVTVYLDGHMSSAFTTSDGGLTYEPAKGQFDTLTVESSNLVYRTMDGTKYVFSKKLTDQFGLIEEIVDPNNNKLQFGYTSVRDIPLLTNVTSTAGQLITFNYPASTATNWDKVSSITESLSGSTRTVADYTYDSNGYLTTAKQYRYASAVATTITHAYTYDSNGRLYTYTSPLSTVLTNVYDSGGRVTKQFEQKSGGTDKLIYGIAYNDSVDPLVLGSAHCSVLTTYLTVAPTTTMATKTCYNSDELKIFEQDGDNNIEKWDYNSYGLMSQYVDQNNSTTTYSYDSKRRKIAEVLPDTTTYGTQIGFDYEDNFNRVTQQTVTSTLLSNSSTQVKINKFGIDNYGNVASSTDALGNSEYYIYNSYGNLTQRTDKNGGVTTFGYDTNNNYLTQKSTTVTQADSTSQTITENYIYDVYGNKSSFTNPNSKIYTYVYDSHGNLRQLTDPDGYVEQYVYDVHNNLTSKSNKLTKVTNYTYDTDIANSLTKVEQVSTAGNIAVNKEYDLVGNLTKEIDPRGYSTSYEYNGANRITKKTGPLNTVNYTYYPNGQLKTEINSLGQKTEYIYDVRNQLTETRKYLDATNYVSNKVFYDGFGRKVSEIDGEGNTTSYVYDLNDRLINVQDALSSITTYGYDKNGNKTSELLPRAQTSSLLRNSNGHSNTYTYDGANRLIKITNALDKQTWNIYDAIGNKTKVIDRQNSNLTSNTHTTQYTYDNLDRVYQETDAYSNVTTYLYFGDNTLKSKTSPIGVKDSYTYDDFGRLLTETDFANNVTTYSYDKNGNKKSITYADTKTTNYYYDANNKLTSIVDADGQTRGFDYDVVGNQETAVNKRGYTTTYSYDNLNRLVKEVNPQNTATYYFYDNNGNRTDMAVGGTVTTTYTYDSVNRLETTTYPTGKSESFVYDSNGNVTSKTNGANEVTTYTYDALDRALTKQMPDITTNSSYVYDNWDNLSKLTDESGVLDYVYDYKNQVTSESKDFSNTTSTFPIAVVGRTYNADGQLYTLTDSANRVFTYYYTTRGLLDRVSYSGTDLADYAYNAVGDISSIVYGNGVVTTYDYDSLQRVSEIETKIGTSTLFSHLYDYDAESNLTSTTEDGLRTISYSYDNLDQLATVDYNNVSSTGSNELQYTYDKFGNRTKLVTPTDIVDYTYNGANQLTSYNYNGRLNTDYTYDDNGAVQTKIQTRLGEIRTATNHTFDSQERLKQMVYVYAQDGVVTVPNNTMYYVYDDYGNRTYKQSNSDKTYYVNNGLNVLNELDAVGVTTKSIVMGNAQIAEIDKNGVIKYFHQDALGSTVLVTDQSGNIDQKYEYDPFGQAIGAILAADNNTNYLYTGQEFDPESQYYYYNARYYDPAIGRFLSRDPFNGRDGDSLSRNGYIYVKNNPLKYVDPSGELEQDAKSSTPRSSNNDVVYNQNNTETYLDILGFAPYLGFVVDLFRPEGELNANEEKYLAASSIGVYGGTQTVKNNLKNKIGATGKIGEDALVKEFGGQSQVRQPTLLGDRITDQVSNGVGYESKVGYNSLTKSKNSASLITSTPSCLALTSLLPALSPANT